MTKTRVYLFGKDWDGARVLVNPPNLEELKNSPDAFINPDISRVSHISPSLWTRNEDGTINVPRPVHLHEENEKAHSPSKMDFTFHSNETQTESSNEPFPMNTIPFISQPVEPSLYVSNQDPVILSLLEKCREQKLEHQMLKCHFLRHVNQIKRHEWIHFFLVLAFLFDLVMALRIHH